MRDSGPQDTAPPEGGEAGRSYREMLSSSAVIGASSVLGVLIGMVRTKLMATLLGPAGYGVFGAYALIAELARSVAQMGLTASGVRQIAASAASGDTPQLARTALVLRRVALVCGLLGVGLLVLLAEPLSRLSFGDTAHAPAVSLLSLAVFFSVLAGAQTALLQGLRRVADLARVTVLGALFGSLTAVPTIYLLGEAGVVPALVLSAASGLGVSWWYSRRHQQQAPAVSLPALVADAATLLKLGLAVMASGLLMTGAAYAVRTIVLRQNGAEAAGMYYAAWTLGGLYIGFVLQAIGTDFYPRLVGLALDDVASNLLVNQQARVSALLALPGVLGTLALAPWAISVFYSAEFAQAVPVLRWICLGMAMRVLTWPVGTIIMARNRQLLLLGTELAWAVVNVGLTWWWVPLYGVSGAGMAFFAAYLLHALMVYPVARHLTGFRVETGYPRIALGSAAAVALVFVATAWLPPRAGLLLGLAATCLSAWVSARVLVRLAEPGHLPRPLRRVLVLQGRLRRMVQGGASRSAIVGKEVS